MLKVYPDAAVKPLQFNAERITDFPLSFDLIESATCAVVRSYSNVSLRVVRPIVLVQYLARTHLLYCYHDAHDGTFLVNFECLSDCQIW